MPLFFKYLVLIKQCVTKKNVIKNPIKNENNANNIYKK